MSVPAVKRSILFSLALMLLLAVLLSLALGPVSIPFTDAIGALLHRVTGWTVAADTALIVEHIRLPRTLMGMLIGATLALTGAAMQGLFRNPLADPALIGVSSGAALGAALVIVLGSVWLAALPPALMPYTQAAGAFAGALLTTWLVYRLGSSNQGVSMASMLLAGVAIAALSAAVVGLLTYIADDAMLRALTFWNMGSLGAASYDRVGMLLVLTKVLSCPLLKTPIKNLLLK